MKLIALNTEGIQPGWLKNCEQLAGLTDKAIGKLPGIIHLVFCDDQSIQALNKAYRNKNKVTDVLSFSYYQGKTRADELVGEVIIDLDQTKRQAKAAKRSVEMEMYTLCIHGLLHLRGYDHEQEEDFRVMKLLEDKIMNLFLRSSKK